MAPTTSRSRHHMGKGRITPHLTKSVVQGHPNRHGVPNSDLANIAQIPDLESNNITQDDLDRAEAVRLRILRSNRTKAGMTVQQVRKARSKVLEPSDNKDPPLSTSPTRSNIAPIELHPQEYFHNMNKKTESLWETSGLQPGHPGYGYKPDGTPTGSEYILHTRHKGYSSFMNGDRTSPPGAAQDKAVCEELKRGRWYRTEERLQGVAGKSIYKHKRSTVSDARAYNAKREAEELYGVQKSNAELDFE